MTGRGIHFEIPVDDGQRAVAFHSDACGWDLQLWGPVEYWTTTALFEDTEANKVGAFEEDSDAPMPEGGMPA